MVRNEPFSQSYLAESVTQELLEVTEHAHEIVERETGFVLDGSTRAVVVGREDWAEANIAMTRRMLSPLFERLDLQDASEEKASEVEIGTSADQSDRLRAVASVAGAKVQQVTRVVSAHLAGAQLGGVLGWMSGRVLGQYEMRFDDSQDVSAQDRVYYVLPNLLQLERRYAFSPGQFRLWVAVHECTHRGQFTGVSWMTAHFRSLVAELSESLTESTVDGMLERLRAARGRHDLEAAERPAFAAVMTKEQQAIMDRLMGLMSLLEGHAEVTMSRAAEREIPEAERFHRVMRERRVQASWVNKWIQRVLGMDQKLLQYAQGEQFVKSLEEHGGREFAARVWEAPENLPTIQEIRAPEQWITRVGS